MPFGCSPSQSLPLTMARSAMSLPPMGAEFRPVIAARASGSENGSRMNCGTETHGVGGWTRRGAEAATMPPAEHH